jgi:anti-sigma factor RsiW
MTDARHYAEELQDLLDGRLAEPLRSHVSTHVDSCSRCQRELAALRWTKDEIARHRHDEDLPEELAARVRASLATEDRRSRRMKVPRRAWIMGAIAAAALLVVFFRGHKSSPLPYIAADFLAYDTGALTLAMQSGDPRTVEAYFARNGIDFPTHVYDLGMMQYRLTGGHVHRLAGRPSALFAYRGPSDTSLVCQMYEGSLDELPATDDVREHNGITFRVYRADDVTMVFWEEGEMVCVLASDAAPESVVQLAFAKAMGVSPPGAD